MAARREAQDKPPMPEPMTMQSTSSSCDDDWRAAVSCCECGELLGEMAR